MIPNGDPMALESAAKDLAGLAGDMDDMQYELLGIASTLLSRWKDAGADGFARHIEKRGKVFSLAREALTGVADGLQQYATRLSEAQQKTKQKQQAALAAGLHLWGDQVDPLSLVPPSPTKVAAAADLEHQIMESEAEGVWAGSQLVLELGRQDMLADQAKALLGDQGSGGLGGFLSDAGAATLAFGREFGTGVLVPASALYMAYQGNPEGLRQYGGQLLAAFQFAKEHPNEALDAFYGSDQMQSEWDSGHPGKSFATLLWTLAMVTDPAGGDEGGVAKGISREERLAKSAKAASSASRHVPGEVAHVATSSGQSVPVPKHWNARLADNGEGVVYQRPDATGNADSVRIMNPTEQYPQGYVRYYNSSGQPLDLNGQPGSRETTHIPPDQMSNAKGYQEWLKNE